MDAETVDEFGRCCTQFSEAVVAFGAIQLLSAQVSGMEALNSYRLSRDESIAYTDTDFQAIAEEMDGIVGQLDG